MTTTLDLNERRVQDELIQLMRDEFGYRYMGRLDIDLQMFDALGRIPKSIVGKTVKMDNKNIDAPKFSKFLKHKGWSETQRSQAYHTLLDAAMCQHRFC